MKIYDIINEDGVIVPGVNTTVDVKPGQTEKEAAKFFGKGKPAELHKKARKNNLRKRTTTAIPVIAS